MEDDCCSQKSNNDYQSVLVTTDSQEGYDSKCKLCEHKFDEHLKHTYVKHCSSVKCNDENNKCPIKYKVSKCYLTNKYFIEEPFSIFHLNKYPSKVDKHHGVHSYFINEIVRLNDEQDRPPKTLLNVLICNRNKGLYDMRIPLPTHDQIKSIKYGPNKRMGDLNEIGPVQEFIDSKLIKTQDELGKLESTKAFCFACDVKTGSDLNHCFMFFTSKNLLQNINNQKEGFPNIYHIDCTYKINNNRFPLIAFGKSDVAGQFILICLAITSHEQEYDFRIFYETLIKLCDFCNIKFEPNFIVQDASVACYNARTVFSHNVNIIMCYFHVVKNVRESNKLRKEYLDMVLSDIKVLHYSKNLIEFEVNKHNILTKWYSNPNLHSFTLYFVKQWIINYRFNNWIIFSTPPGFAATNNPIESFNFQFKDQFTHFKSRNMLDCAKLICDQVIPIYSDTIPVFRYSREHNMKVKNKAKNLDEKLFFRSFHHPDFVYFYGKSSVSIINLELRNCSCRWFLAYAACAHVYKAMQIYDIQSASTKFVIRPRLGRKGPKAQNKQQFNSEEKLAQDSLMTETQLLMFKTLVEFYNKINNYIFQYQFIQDSPKVTEIITSKILDPEEEQSNRIATTETTVTRKRGRPKNVKGALKY